ncbi:MAG: M20 family metallo-hydrolase [Muribaculaceae bacterium]|nr:M20 family metallo-hydrolase [Muribaculaceae bacterium]
MDEYIYDAIDFLKDLISKPSISRDEVGAADMVQCYIENAGFKAMRRGNNVWCVDSEFDEEKPTILLNSHIDTVKPVNGWTKDPFMPTLEDTRLYGLGSNDAGASVVSLFAAFRILMCRKRSCNFIFLASCEEEVSGKNGIESVLNLLPRIDVALVGEPTGMQPAVAEKGLMVLDGVVTGVSGHAARNEGINAIYRAIPVIEKLRNAAFERISEHLGDIKVSVTQIESGTQHNVVPDKCKIVVDVRTTDVFSNIETLALLQAMVPECELTPRSTRLNSSKIDISHPIVERAIRLGKEPFGSPTLSDQSLIPCQSLKMGPGNSARSHTADEYIELDEIRNAIFTYVALLDGIKL